MSAAGPGSPTSADGGGSTNGGGSADGSTPVDQLTTTFGALSMLPTPSIQLARSLLSVQVEDLNGMTPFNLFKSQIESGSVEAAVDAMKRLGVVAAAMESSQQVSVQLVPYLTQLVLQQPPLVDELLLILGQQLPSVADVMKDPAYILDFLPMMERLAAVEETVVRDQAVIVLNDFAKRVKQQQPQANGGPAWADPAPWIAMTKRLASADWFTAKVSASGVLYSVLALLPPNGEGAESAEGEGGGSPQQLELLAIYKELCTDETPMVRRAAAKHLGKVVNVSGWPCREWASQHFTALAHDEQDSVRLLAVASMSDISPDTFVGAHAGGTTHGPTWTLQHLLPLLKDGSTDLSWRVRHNLAKTFSDVAQVLGISGDRRYPNEQALVMSCFVSLLRDAEAEVRAAAVGHLARMVSWGGPSHFASHLQALLPALADDVVMEVRSKCALALMDAAHSGTLEDSVILNSFGPLLENFLQDEFQEVQLQVLSNLHKISHLLPGLTGVVTSLLQMAKASNWRVREAIAKLLPFLAEARGLDFFQTVLLEPAWLTLLQDPVATVRVALVQGVPLLVKVAGEEWILSNVLPQHAHIMNSAAQSYLQRMTVVQTYVAAACATASAESGPLWEETSNLVVQTAVQDRVANVRMIASHGIRQIALTEHIGPNGDGNATAVSLTPAATAYLRTRAKPALEQRLPEETDADCQYALQGAIDAISLLK